ncbi:MAG TPA: hypothetical protein VIC34_16195 [Croceibacterium sp.]|jgi:hypothetical protein
MSEPKDKPTREERLAAKLRENLRRRKAQSRDINSRAKGDDKPTLSKEDGKS